MRTALTLTCGVLFSLSPLTSAGEPEALTGESIDLVRKLGDADFRVREEADRELARRGAAALVEVQRGAEDADLEIRRRSQNLLAMLQKSDVDRLLSPFMAGKEDPKTPLPAWDAVKKLMGDDGTSRFLYALLYKSDRTFLETLEKDPKAAQGQLTERVRKLTPLYTGGGIAARRTAPPPAIEDVASVLLLASTLPPEKTSVQPVMMLLNQASVQQSVGWSHAMRKLTAKFLEQRCDDPQTGTQAARLAAIYGCHDLIEKRFRPATEKLLESAAANPGDFALFYRALNQARQYNMNDLIDRKLKPALLANVTKMAAADSVDVNHLSQAVNQCQNVGGMEHDLKPVLRPALTKLVKKQAEQIDESSRMHQLVHLARSSQCQDLIDDVLRPAYRKKLSRLTPQDKEQNQLTMALQYAQVLGMQEEIETILKPAAASLLLEAAEHPRDVNRLQQAVNIAQTFGLREGVRPLAQLLLDDAGKSAPDVNRLSAALQLVRMSDLPNVNEAIEQKIKPAARKALADAKNQPVNLATVSRSIAMAEELQLKEGSAFALKAAATKSLPSYVRGQALMHVAKFGDKDAIPQLELLLEDTADLGSTMANNVLVRTRVGDMALGALIHVSGQKIDDYKLPWPRAVGGGGIVAVPGGRVVLAGPNYYGFDTDAARQAARKQWRDSQPETK